MKLWGKLHKNYYILYIVSWSNSNSYISHCSTNWWSCLIEKEGMVDYMYLASIWTIRLFIRCCDICKVYRSSCI